MFELALSLPRNVFRGRGYLADGATRTMFLSSSTRAYPRESARIRSLSTTNDVVVVRVLGMTTGGRPREYDSDRVTKAIRISPELDARLKQAARERGVSVNLLMNSAVADYLDRLLPVDQVLRTA